MTRAGTLWPTIAAVATNGGLLERRIGGFRLEWTPYVGFLFRRYSDPMADKRRDCRRPAVSPNRRGADQGSRCRGPCRLACPAGVQVAAARRIAIACRS